ncbi:MAG: tetratricopeptide repeat protein [Symploca sp. SIO2C1]|nr:tetratricopeptide repeat protein [Symploca sp. SIO2C1]
MQCRDTHQLKSYRRIGFATLITCLGIVLTPRVSLSATITRPELSPSAQGHGFDEIGIAGQIANQPTESTEPRVPAPLPRLITPIPPPSRLCLSKSTSLLRPSRLFTRRRTTTRPRFIRRNFSSKDQLLSEIALQYASIGQFDKALQVAQTIESASNQADALTKIATQLVEAGQQSKASEILSQALEIAESLNTKPLTIRRESVPPRPLTPRFELTPRRFTPPPEFTQPTK